MRSTGRSRNGSRTRTLILRCVGTLRRTFIWPRRNPRRSHTLKWMPVAYRRYGAFRRAAVRIAFCCIATPAAQSSPRCILTERRLGTSPRWWQHAPSSWITGVHPNTSSPRRSMTLRGRIAGSLPAAFAPRTSPSIGHSVGGNLAVSLAVTLREKGIPLPAAILSVSPWYDMEEKNATLDSNAETDALITRAALETFRELWIGDTDVAWNDPRVNMLYADLTGLPPIMVYYGAHEILAGEAVEFAK